MRWAATRGAGKRVRSRRYVAAGLAALVIAVTSAAISAGAAGILPPSNPAANIAPHPNFLASGVCHVTLLALPCANPCVRVDGVGPSAHVAFPIFSNAPTCIRFVLSSINGARTQEALDPITLPSDWYSLSAPQQLFVIADLERTSRGLPPYLGLNRQLSAAAQRAALQGVDPPFAPGFNVGLDRHGVRGMGSTIAYGFSVLGADYVWMYEDGWGGSVAVTPNEACTYAGAPGCWGHRDQILGADGSYNEGVGLHCRNCEMGAGFAVVSGVATFTDLIELPAGSAPPMYFTWSKDVVPYLTTTSPSTTTTVP